MTLIEVLVSVVLFALLSIGALSALTGQQTTSSIQERDDSLLANARGSLSSIAKQIRMAVGGTIAGTAVVNRLVGDRPATTHTCPSAAATDVVPDCNNGVVPVIRVVNCSTGSDALTILYPDGSSWGVLSADASSTVAVDPRGAVMQVRTVAVNDLSTLATAAPYDWVLLSNFTAGVVVKMTAAVSTTSVAPCAASGTDVCLAKDAATATYPAIFGVGSIVTKARWLLYRTSTAYFGTEQPVLEVTDLASTTAQPGAIDIEDLQVALGIDGNADGLLSEEATPTLNGDDWVGNFAGETATCAQMANLRAVRVTIVARAGSMPGGVRVVPPSIEDHDRSSEPATADHRVVLREVIALRNKDLQ